MIHWRIRMMFKNTYLVSASDWSGNPGVSCTLQICFLFMHLIVGYSDYQLVAGIQGLHHSTWKRSRAINTCCFGEWNCYMSNGDQVKSGHFSCYMKCFPMQKLPWFSRNQAVVEEYLAFLSNLVSAQTVHLRACLRMVVSNFAPSKIYYDPLLMLHSIHFTSDHLKSYCCFVFPQRE